MIDGGWAVLLMALSFGLAFGIPALIATYSEYREQRRKEELAKKLHL